MKLEKKTGAFQPARPTGKFLFDAAGVASILAPRLAPRLGTVLGACMVLCLCLGSVNAQEKTVEAIQEELKEVQRKILAAEKAALADPRVAAKQVELDEGFDEYAAFQKTFPPLKAAYKEQYDSVDNLRAVTMERAKTFPAAMEQQAIIDATGDRVRALRWDITMARMKFHHPDSPFQRMVDGDQNYMALAEGKEPPNVESPEVKAWMMKTPLPEVRHAIMLAIPEAKDLSVQLKAWSNEVAQVEKDFIRAKTELSRVRQNMQNGDDPETLAAKLRLDEALNEVSRVRNLPEFRVVADAKRARHASLKKLVADIAREDPAVLALVERRDNLQKIQRTRALEMSRRSRPQIPQK